MESNKPQLTRERSELIIEVITWTSLLLLLWIS